MMKFFIIAFQIYISNLLLVVSQIPNSYQIIEIFTTKFQNQNMRNHTILIQCCQNCKAHQTITQHKEQMYLAKFNQVKRFLQNRYSNISIVKNSKPKSFKQLIHGVANEYLDQNTGNKVIFPAIGSFDIIFRNKIIFSKHNNERFPSNYELVEQLDRMIGRNIDLQRKKNRRIEQRMESGREQKQMVKYVSKKQIKFHRSQMNIESLKRIVGVPTCSMKQIQSQKQGLIYLSKQQDIEQQDNGQIVTYNINEIGKKQQQNIVKIRNSQLNAIIYHAKFNQMYGIQ